jgi:hypothetical protein
VQLPEERHDLRRPSPLTRASPRGYGGGEPYSGAGERFTEDALNIRILPRRRLVAP